MPTTITLPSVESAYTKIKNLLPAEWKITSLNIWTEDGVFDICLKGFSLFPRRVAYVSIDNNQVRIQVNNNLYEKELKALAKKLERQSWYKVEIKIWK